MCENIAGALGCGTDAVSVKATTEETLWLYRKLSGHEVLCGRANRKKRSVTA
jgi:2C-methyl-D-erythritol 2,4-cyclodiphosphate synthase